MSKHLYVTNISTDTTMEEFSQLFTRVGTVVAMEISADPHTGKQKDYGFVEMATGELAQAAAQSVTGYLLHNRKIQVKVIGGHGPDRSIALDDDSKSGTGQRRKRPAAK
jgi:RNA recognition motif-containing protein